jgi:hypothetical protein
MLHFFQGVFQEDGNFAAPHSSVKDSDEVDSKSSVNGDAYFDSSSNGFNSLRNRSIPVTAAVSNKNSSKLNINKNSTSNKRGRFNVEEEEEEEADEEEEEVPQSKYHRGATSSRTMDYEDYGGDEYY